MRFHTPLRVNMIVPKQPSILRASPPKAMPSSSKTPLHFDVEEKEHAT